MSKFTLGVSPVPAKMEGDRQLSMNKREYEQDIPSPGWLYAIIFILPFLMLHWMIPFVSDQSIGNDYQRFAIDQQMELMFSLKTGSFPLYVPGFAEGQSASALTQGQIFHPLAHLASWMPGYWSGNALDGNTLMRLFSLAGAHLTLFLFLRRLGLAGIIAFVTSTVTVYNLRMLDLFRYGASLESWTGFLFLCSAIGGYGLKPGKWEGPLLIIASTFYLICSGHPQMMYYALLGAGMFTLVTPHFLAEMLPDREMNARLAVKFWARAGLWIGLGILLSSAYIFPFYFEFVKTNAGRVGRTYEWADMYRDTFTGTLNNFFHPLRSEIHGAFGGSSLYLPAVLTPLVLLFRVKIPRVIWGIMGLVLLVFLHIQGVRTPVHYLVWEHLPFASSFRIAGRVSLILPVFLMLMLAWMTRKDKTEAFPVRVAGRELWIIPRMMPIIAALVLTAGYACISPFMIESPKTFIPIKIREVPFWVEPTMLGMGMAALVALTLHGYVGWKLETGKLETGNWKLENRKLETGNWKLVADLFLGLTVCIQMAGTLHYGTWVEEKREKPTFEQMLEAKRENLSHYPDLPGYGMGNAVVTRQATRAYLEPFLGKIYIRHLIARNNDEAYTLMTQDRQADQVVVEGYMPDADNSPPLTEMGDKRPDRVKLTFSSFNRLVFEAQASRPSFFGFSPPHTGAWQAAVNGQPARIYRANGGSHAVRMPAGVTRVEFRYESRATFLGMLVSGVTLVIIACLMGCRCVREKPGFFPNGPIPEPQEKAGFLFFPKKRLATLILTAALALSVGGFSLWHRSLYNGENIGSTYSWTSDESPPVSNMAYSKRTKLSSNAYGPGHSYIHAGGRGVDGDRRPESGFMTRLQKRPWWIVDLHSPKQIGLIKLYESRRGPTYNRRPLTVSLSNNQRDWETKTFSKQNESPLGLVFEKPVTARYVLIQASGNCRLSFDEVEIYEKDEG